MFSNISVTAGFAVDSSTVSPVRTPSCAIKIPQRRRRTSTLSDVTDASRPSSAYSYDGGLFVTANNRNKDFFVINPEWVSEDETVKKLSGGVETKMAMSQEDAAKGECDVVDAPRPQPITWKSYARRNPSRSRASSAPPARLRNPITWVGPE